MEAWETSLSRVFTKALLKSEHTRMIYVLGFSRLYTKVFPSHLGARNKLKRSPNKFTMVGATFWGIRDTFGALKWPVNARISNIYKMNPVIYIDAKKSRFQCSPSLMSIPPEFPLCSSHPPLLLLVFSSQHPRSSSKLHQSTARTIPPYQSIFRPRNMLISCKRQLSLKYNVWTVVGNNLNHINLSTFSSNGMYQT